jgi:hypothetical protein
LIRSLLLASLTLVSLDLAAQTPQEAPPAQAPKPAPPQVARDPVFVRRISLGLTASFLPLNPMRSEDVTETPSTNPPVEVKSTNDPRSNIAAYGAIVQFAVTERFAFAVNPIVRKIGYEANTQRFEGIDNPTTFADERRITFTKQDTRARYIDIPALVRYYGKDRTEFGHRWFAEIGPTLRLVRRVRTAREITLPDQSVVRDNVQAAHRKSVLGLTAGFGGQFIDPLGIRLVPGVRYTRWFNTPFSGISGRSRRHGVEIHISLTF